MRFTPTARCIRRIAVAFRDRRFWRIIVNPDNFHLIRAMEAAQFGRGIFCCFAQVPHERVIVVGSGVSTDTLLRPLKKADGVIYAARLHLELVLSISTVWQHIERLSHTVTERELWELICNFEASFTEDDENSLAQRISIRLQDAHRKLKAKAKESS